MRDTVKRGARSVVETALWIGVWTVALGGCPRSQDATLDCGSCAADPTSGSDGGDRVSDSDAATGSAVLSWTMPTTRVDGSPLAPSEIGGYRIYYGTTSRAYGLPVDVGAVLSHTIDGLSSGATYYFATTVYDTAGNESLYTDEKTKTFP